jgi:hypothetical protein
MQSIEHLTNEFNNGPTELFKNYDAICETIISNQLDQLPVKTLDLHIANVKQAINTGHAQMKMFLSLQEVAKMEKDDNLIGQYSAEYKRIESLTKTQHAHMLKLLKELKVLKAPTDNSL